MLVLVLPVLLALALEAPVFAGGQINADEAMRLAEAYVRANGYTDAPPSKRVRDPESFQRSPEKLRLTGPQQLLKARAWGFRRGSRSDLAQGWTVIFLIVQKPLFKMNPNETAYGQEVEMDRYGKRLIVLHGVTIAYDNMGFPAFTKRAGLSAVARGGKGPPSGNSVQR